MATGTIQKNQSQLLWTNSSPSTARGGFSVPLDLTSYTAIIVFFRFKTDSTLGKACDAIVGDTTYWTCAVWGNKYENYSRAFRAFTTSVQFDSCYDGSTEYTSYMIPYKIIGIK